MNRIHLRLLPLVLFFTLASSHMYSQENNEFIPDSIDSVDSTDYKYLKNKYPLDSLQLSTYKTAIDNFANQDKHSFPGKDKIVFVGSSTIALWNYRIQSDMSPLPIINRGFGGSVILENIFYYSQVVKPYEPRIVVLYCENDIISSPVSTIFEKFRYFEELLHSDFPNCKLFIVSFKPSISRKSFIPNMEKLNTLLAKYASKRPNTSFIDVFHAMLTNGSVNESLFRNDYLHLNDTGYDLWTSIIKPQLTTTYYKIATHTNDSSIDRTISLSNNNLILNGYISQISIYNTSGKLLISAKTDGIYTYSLEHLSAGIYILSAKMNGKYVKQKIVITP